MVNNDRIVPIQKIDYLSMVGTIMAIHAENVSSFAVIAPADVEGEFTVTGSGAAGKKLANQPVKSLNYGSGVTSATVYFVPAYDFAEILVNGSAATISDGGVALADVKKDGITLYKAVLGSGSVTITELTPAVAAS